MSETKLLYMIAGGTDGYVNIKFSFDYDAIRRYADKYEESFGGTDSDTYIRVPADATYESLGIRYPVELDMDDDDE